MTEQYEGYQINSHCEGLLSSKNILVFPFPSPRLSLESCEPSMYIVLVETELFCLIR